jgi:hypothetical protein
MKKGLILVFALITSLQAFSQWSIETTFTQFKEGKAVITTKRSLFDSEDRYDKKNRLVEKVYLGSVTKGARAVFFYDDKDQKVKEQHYDSLGKVRTTKIFTYTDQGKVSTITFEWVEKNGEKRNGKEEYFYNKENELIHKTYTTSKDGLESEWFFENKKENGHRIVVTKHVTKGAEQKPSVVEYNEKDLVIKEGSLTYEYEYDDKGDWKVKKMFRNGALVGEYTRIKKKG